MHQYTEKLGYGHAIKFGHEIASYVSSTIDVLNTIPTLKLKVNIIEFCDATLF